MEKSDPRLYNDAWAVVSTVDGILVPGGFGERGIEGMIAAANFARERGVPYLGVCLGMQVAVIEFARNVLGWGSANSTEFDADTERPVVIEMPEHNPGDMGGTMRLGKRRTIFKTQQSLLYKLYKRQPHVDERHRHRYEVNPKFIHDFETKLGNAVTTNKLNE